jgi:hypothetical protein
MIRNLSMSFDIDNLKRIRNWNKKVFIINVTMIRVTYESENEMSMLPRAEIFK